VNRSQKGLDVFLATVRKGQSEIRLDVSVSVRFAPSAAAFKRAVIGGA
jgi:hypothetical protein